MKTTKRFLSAFMAMSLVFGSVAIVSAEEDTNIMGLGDSSTSGTGTTNGSGKSEGYIDMEVIKVRLPLDSLEYIIDPQGLIKQSGNAKRSSDKNTTFVYSTKEATKQVTDAKVAANATNNVLDNGFVFFKTTTGTGTSAKTTYANYKELEVENRSPVAVDVSASMSFKIGDAPKAGSVYTKTANEENPVVFALTEQNKVKEGNKVVTHSKELTADDKTATIDDAKSYFKVTYVPQNDNTIAHYEYKIDEDAYKKAKEFPNKKTFVIEGYSLPTFSSTETTTLSVVWSFTKHPESTTTDPSNNGG